MDGRANTSIFRKRLCPIILVGLILANAAGAFGAPPSAIESLLKHEVYRRVMDGRSIMTYASLQDAPASACAGVPKVPSSDSCRDYSFYAAMLVDASLAKTRRILTDYSLYAKMIPYINEAKYDAKTHLLALSGGIWRFQLHSVLRFEERGERSIHYVIVSGHFPGLAGDILFEPATGPSGEIMTLVMMRGDQKHWAFPPRLIIEQGAQIVFEFTAARMRSYIQEKSSTEPPQELPKESPKESSEDAKSKVPQPRSHL